MSTAEPHPATPKPKLRWYQFSLRSLLVFTAVFAAVAALIFTPTRTQRIAREIKAMGGDFDVEYVGPNWVRKWFGRAVDRRTIIGPFDKLTKVALGQRGGSTSPEPSDVHDEWLDNLAGQTSLRELNLSWTPITDDGILRLDDLPELQTLRVEILPLTDRSVAQIAGFAGLEELWIGYTEITDHGIRHLKRLPNLKRLVLRNTTISDNAIPHLKELRSLEYLDLSSTDVTDAGVVILERALPKCLVCKLWASRSPVRYNTGQRSGSAD